MAKTNHTQKVAHPSRRPFRGMPIKYSLDDVYGQRVLTREEAVWLTSQVKLPALTDEDYAAMLNYPVKVIRDIRQRRSARLFEYRQYKRREAAKEFLAAQERVQGPTLSEDTPLSREAAEAILAHYDRGVTAIDLAERHETTTQIVLALLKLNRLRGWTA